MLRFFLVLSLFILTSNCSLTSGTSLLGPIFTVATSGSIYQASLSYSSSQFINNLKKEYEDKTKKIKDKSIEMIDTIDDKFKIPPIQLSLNVENVEISQINEPEPLP